MPKPPMDGNFLPIYTVDAFTDTPFHGNQAAVCLVKNELPETQMQEIAKEMNISETAYIESYDGADNFSTGNRFKLRWFTPTNEVPLCGHATVAAAAVLFFTQDNKSECITFDTASGALATYRHGNSGVTMNFPNNKPVPQDIQDVKPLLQLIVPEDSIHSVHFSETTKKLLLRLNDSFTREDLEKLRPDIGSFQSVESSGKIKGIIVTVKGDSGSSGDNCKKRKTYDFYSRYFAPWNGIPEDPVTGSAHTVLGGYWSEVLQKKNMYARQCSSRGGDVAIEMADDGRVILTGEAVVVLKGQLMV